MEALLGIPKGSALWAWAILIMAVLGTYLWRALGVLLSGKMDQEGAFFRWLTCVTYAMVASLVVRIIVLPVGLVAQLPLSYRLVATGAALVVMMSRKNGLVPALAVGTVLITLLAWVG
jgi:branched-subunit amino acid transport protein